MLGLFIAGLAVSLIDLATFSFGEVYFEALQIAIMAIAALYGGVSK